MYIPFRKIYRAFGELRHLSDEECERYVRRARLKQGSSALIPPAAAAAGGLAWAAVIAWTAHAKIGITSITPDAVLNNRLLVAGVVASTVLMAAITGLLARDLVLLHLIRREVHRARCPKCGQSLLGLPIRSRVLGPPEPGDATVRCPECGRVWVLFDLGLRPTDLVPWEMRGVPEDYGKIVTK